jgi:hypothetical protein
MAKKCFPVVQIKLLYQRQSNKIILLSILSAYSALNDFIDKIN